MARFTVTTWNLENLFLPEAETGPLLEGFERKLDGLAETIHHIDPDVLAVQEVGHREALERLLARPQLDGCYPEVVVAEHIDPSHSIRVGFASKLPIEDREEIDIFPAESLLLVGANGDRGRPVETLFRRPVLRIRVRPFPDRMITLVTAHLKSKLLTYDSLRSGHSRFSPRDETEHALAAGHALLTRAAEAVALRALLDRLLEDPSTGDLVVLADLNDGPDAATTQIIAGPSGSEIGTPGFDRPDRGDRMRLFNLAPCIARPEWAYSRRRFSTAELVDHVFASIGLLPAHPHRRPTVFCGESPDNAPLLPSIANIPGATHVQAPSDHAPVTAVFQL